MNIIECYAFLVLVLSNYLQGTYQNCDKNKDYDAEILKDVAVFYQSRCLIVVESCAECLTANRKIVEMEKTMETQFVVVIRLLDLDEMVDSFDCQQNRPLYVLFDGSGTRRYLERTIQLSSYPRWILFLDNTKTNNYLNQTRIPFDCEFLTVKHTDNHAELSLVYKVHDGGPLMVDPFALWVPNVGLEILDEEPLYEKRRDFQGLQLKAMATTTSPPAVVVEFPTEKGGAIKVGGFLGSIWILLGEILNFSYELTPTADPASVFINKLANNSQDCLVADVTMIGIRLDKGCFLMTLITSKLRLIIRKPDEVGVEWDVLLAPFNKYLWATFLLSLIVIGVCLGYVQKTTIRYRKDGVKTGRHGDSFLVVLGLFCHQGCDMSCRPTSARTLMITVSLTSLVFMAAYSGVLISFLANQELQFPFQGLQGLADDGTYKLGTLQGSATLEMFYNASTPLYQHLYDKYFHQDGTGLPLYAMKDLPLICNESFAFLATREYKEKNDKEVNYACKMIWLDEIIRPLSSSIVLSKKSPYRGVFDYWLHKLRDTGTLSHLRLVTWPDRLKFTDAPPEFTSLSFTHVAPILSMLASGVVVALGILLLEMAVSRWHRRDRG